MDILVNHWSIKWDKKFESARSSLMLNSKEYRKLYNAFSFVLIFIIRSKERDTVVVMRTVHMLCSGAGANLKGEMSQRPYK